MFFSSAVGSRFLSLAGIHRDSFNCSEDQVKTKWVQNVMHFSRNDLNTTICQFDHPYLVSLFEMLVQFVYERKLLFQTIILRMSNLKFPGYTGQLHVFSVAIESITGMQIPGASSSHIWGYFFS